MIMKRIYTRVYQPVKENKRKVSKLIETKVVEEF